MMMMMIRCDCICQWFAATNIDHSSSLQGVLRRPARKLDEGDDDDNDEGDDDDDSDDNDDDDDDDDD